MKRATRTTSLINVRTLAEKGTSSPRKQISVADMPPAPRPNVGIGSGAQNDANHAHRYETRTASKKEAMAKVNAQLQTSVPSPSPTQPKSPHFTRSSAKASFVHHIATKNEESTPEQHRKTRLSSHPAPKSPSRPSTSNTRKGLKRRMSQEIHPTHDESDSEDSEKMDVSSDEHSNRSSASSSSSHSTLRHPASTNTSVSSNDAHTASSNTKSRADEGRGVFGLPEAPVFYPTAEEFADPNAFIERIQAQVEPYGICRIVPPKEWKREAWRLQIDPRTFTFNTKTQSVHSLQVRHGAYCRFLVRLQYYWSHVVGQALTKLPHLDSLPVDLFCLHSLVQENGGFSNMKDEESWLTLFKPLHLNPHATCASSQLATVYRKYLLPFDYYIEDGGYIPEVLIPSNSAPRDSSEAKKSHGNMHSPKTTSSTPTSAESASRPYFTRSSNKRVKTTDESSEESSSEHHDEPKQSEQTHVLVPEVVPGYAARTLEKIEEHPKTTNFGPYGDITEVATDQQTGMWRTVRAHSFAPDQDVSFVTCFYCRKGDKPATLVLCDTPGCAGGAHLRCMIPARSRLPSGRYYCPSCCGEEHPNASSDSIDNHYVSPLHQQHGVTLQADDGTDVEQLELNESLGFGHGFGNRYTLSEFQEMAMKFATFWFPKATTENSEKSNHAAASDGKSDTPTRVTRASSAVRNGAKLATTPMVVSAEEIEREYWKLVSSGDHLVSVQYGSDVDVSFQGARSGFPLDVRGRTVGSDCPEIDRWHTIPQRSAGSSFEKQDVSYLREHGWNLNSLPYVTLLKYLGESVSGVTRPMLYIGMLFSSFCWHTEDNWLYSINYIHTGAPKRWYGVSGANAADFEKAIHSELPHLFTSEPQLLYQLTTALHPDILKKHGVRMCTTLQQEGEFVITFPRAYHSGFNCGYNVAESVNFAAHHWLDWGLMAVNEYRFVRSSVFSHEKILWQIATSASSITSLPLARSVRRQLELYIRYAKAAIKRIQAQGISELLQFSKSHMVLVVDDDDNPIDVKEMPDAASTISRRTHVNIMDKDGFEPQDPQCYVCGYDLFFHRVDCACKSPRMPRCLNHALHPICLCVDEEKFVSFRFRNSSMKAVIKLLDHIIVQLSGEKPKRHSYNNRTTIDANEEVEMEENEPAPLRTTTRRGRSKSVC